MERNSFVDLIGNTPLVRLKRASEATGCEILGKCEFLNPGRPRQGPRGAGIIADAEEKGLLRPGGTIVEGTAGNTGIGLALVGNARGYRTVIVIPETQSQEKKDMLRLVGADLRPVPAVPYKRSQQLREATRAAWPRSWTRREPNGAIWANQFDNVANRDGPLSAPPGPRSGRRPAARSTPSPARSAPAARWPASACASRSATRTCEIVLADPMGAALYNYYKHGELKAEGSSITEGIGQGRITANLEGAPVDDAVQITDAEALPLHLRPGARGGSGARRLVRRSTSRARSASRRSWARAIPS